MNRNFTYKNINITEHSRFDAQEFSFKENTINSDGDLILKFAEFIEYVGFNEPGYIIINSEDWHYQITDSLYPYFRDIVIGQLFDFHLRAIFIIGENAEQLREQIGSFNETIQYCKEFGEVFRKAGFAIQLSN